MFYTNRGTNTADVGDSTHFFGGDLTISAVWLVPSGDHGAYAEAIAGGGVPPEVRERMFTPFFSTKAGGSGVGLSLVRQIALAHGGSIEHRPREGVGFGSVFCLRLPQD